MFVGRSTTTGTRPSCYGRGPMPPMWLNEDGQRAQTQPCARPGCRREVPIRRYSHQTLRLIGWRLYRVSSVVQWCGHPQEFIPVPDEGEWVRMDAGDGHGEVADRLCSQRSLRKNPLYDLAESLHPIAKFVDERCLRALDKVSACRKRLVHLGRVEVVRLRQADLGLELLHDADSYLLRSLLGRRGCGGISTRFPPLVVPLLGSVAECREFVRDP